ncbi:trypsin-like serine peptidase [Streptomyces sp. NPDC087440]|uniref:trypsin-like serine peptidase n=1 Tax=Streptomyces sp. NPDC087440 TaxID=3365790 RepID=UPI0037F2586B
MSRSATSRSARSRGTALLGLAAAVGGLLSVGAAPAPAADTSSALSAALSAEQQVRNFWTTERMRSAKPLDLLQVSPSKLAPAKAGGPTTSVPATSAPAIKAFPQKGGAWTGGGAVVKTSGRVFFTYQGRTASCSGNSVTSQNKSTVVTAGHCVKLDGAWHTNWVFVPAYNDGATPYGTWTAAKTSATDQWAASEDMNYDVGLAVVNPLNGQKLSDVVGAQGIQFNGGYNKPMYAFGFPAAAPYDGKRLIYCSGNTTKDFLLTKDHSLACDMTGGSSGGPWFNSFNESTGTGLQASVNSFGYTFLPGRMYGPYFGNEVKAAYDKAQAS